MYNRGDDTRQIIPALVPTSALIVFGNHHINCVENPEEFILKTISLFWLALAGCLATPSDAVLQTRSATQESRSSANQQKPAPAQVRIPDVIYVPTPPEVVDRMLRMAGVKQGDVLYDLGSGDGRIVITAAKQYKIRGVGIDIDPQRIREAEENARAAGVTDRVRFCNEDLFQANIS